MKLSRTQLLAPVLERPERIDTLELAHLRAVAHGLVELLVRRAEKKPAKRKAKPPPLPRVTGPVSFPVDVRLEGLRIQRGGNDREAVYVRASRVAREKGATSRALGVCPEALPPKLDVTITRYAPGVLDTDNLAGACKSVRDAVAAWLGVDDGVSERAGSVAWYTEQAKTKPGVYHVGVKIEARP